MKRQLVMLLAFGAIVGGLTSCTSVPIVGANGATYYLQPRMDTNGVFQRVMITQSITDGVRATVNGLQDLKIKVVDHRSDKIIGQVNAEMADGKAFKVTVSANMGATEMRIYLSDKGRAQQVFKAISKHLR